MAAAMVLLAGAGLVLASGSLEHRAANGSPEATLAAPPAPALIAPSSALTRQATTDLSGVVPDGLQPASAYALRIYVNDKLERERGLPIETAFTLSGIALDPGANEIRAAIARGDVESERSSAVLITRDDVAPAIRVTRPLPGATLYGATETMRGRTEAGADLEVIVEASGATIAATTAEDGRFEALLSLEMGENSFLLRSADAAGNRASTRLVLTRAVSLASMSLSVSSREMSVVELPASVDVLVEIRDELGVESEGAAVTFSMSPPNRSTTTYRTTSRDGTALWSDVAITGAQRAVGTWLITALAVLPSGVELRGDVSISVAE